MANKKCKIKIICLIFLLCFSAVLFFSYNTSSLTGRAILDLEPEYESEELLGGVLRFTFKEGELIPADSKVIIELNNYSKEFFLYEIINQTKNGNFYVQGTEINGSGKGFGIEGEKIFYPEVEFKLLIYHLYKEKNKSEEVDEEKNKSEKADEEKNKSEKADEEKNKSEKADDRIRVKGEGEGAREDKAEKDKGQTEGAKEKQIKGQPSQDKKAGPQDESKKSDSAEANPSQTKSDSPGSNEKPKTNGKISGVVVYIMEGIIKTISGRTIEPSDFKRNKRTNGTFIIDGKASKNNDFFYNISDEQRAKIIPGSVRYNGALVKDSKLNLKIDNEKAIVSTDYSLSEKGFGEYYLGERTLNISINMSRFNIPAQDGLLSARLIYENKTLSFAEEDIVLSVLNMSSVYEIILLKNIPDFVLDKDEVMILNLSEYFKGASSYNFNVPGVRFSISERVLSFRVEDNFTGIEKANIFAYTGNKSLKSNDFFILSSYNGIFVITIRDKIKTGELVKWTKIILNPEENSSVELPADAVNISIKKIDSGIESLAEAIIRGKISKDSFYNSAAETGIKAGIVSLLPFINKRNIVKIKEEQKVKVKFVSVPEKWKIADTNAEKFEITLTENASYQIIKYYTEAPLAYEEFENLSKKIVVSAPSELNYTDVIANASVEFLNLSIGDESKIGVYWHNYGKEIILKDVEEVEDRKIIDIEPDNMRALENNTKNVINITNSSYLVQKISIKANDSNGDGILDYIEWVVPYLSNQTYFIGLSKGANCEEGCLFIRNSEGKNKAVFDSFGNLALSGKLMQNNSELTPGNDFIIKNSSGGIKAWIDDASGDMRIAGSLIQNTKVSCIAPKDSFIIENKNKSCVVYIDSQGNLWLKGGLNEFS